MEQYTVTGMSCAACQTRVEKAVSKVPGVISCSVSLLTNSMGVEVQLLPQKLLRQFQAAGYGRVRKRSGKSRTDPETALSMMNLPWKTMKPRS